MKKKDKKEKLVRIAKKKIRDLIIIKENSLNLRKLFDSNK